MTAAMAIAPTTTATTRQKLQKLQEWAIQLTQSAQIQSAQIISQTIQLLQDWAPTIKAQEWAI